MYAKKVEMWCLTHEVPSLYLFHPIQLFLALYSESFSQLWLQLSRFQYPNKAQIERMQWILHRVNIRHEYIQSSTHCLTQTCKDKMNTKNNEKTSRHGIPKNKLCSVDAYKWWWTYEVPSLCRDGMLKCMQKR